MCAKTRQESDGWSCWAFDYFYIPYNSLTIGCNQRSFKYINHSFAILYIENIITVDFIYKAFYCTISHTMQSIYVKTTNVRFIEYHYNSGFNKWICALW